MKLLDLEQGSQTWLEARQQKITATDASIITGVNPWCNPYILWKRKLGLEPPQPITPAMERGMRMEDEARRAFEEYTNIKVKPVVVESADKSWMMASLDGLDASRKHQVEIKCPNPATHAMAKAKQVPKYYEAQIQHQLAVTGLEWSYYFSYDGSEGAIVEVERDQAFIDEMIEKEEDFFRRLREFDPPPQSHLVVKTVEMQRAFEEYTNIKVKPVVVESADKSWMMASLDGLDASRKHQVEIKCPNPATHAMAKAKQVPKYYEAQIQHQLAVTGLEWSYYFSYDGSEGAIVEVERDQAFIDEMIEKEEDFFRRLREFDPPPQSHLVVKTVEMQRAVDEYCVAQDMKKKATDYEKKAREKLLSISQGNSIQGFGLKLTHYVERGRVDYMAIPELQGVNLDMYRKSPVEKTRLSFV